MGSSWGRTNQNSRPLFGATKKLFAKKEEVISI
jgi:hypothetical protein